MLTSSNGSIESAIASARRSSSFSGSFKPTTLLSSATPTMTVPLAVLAIAATMEDEAIYTLPDCLAAFMSFLDRAGKLEGDSVDALRATCERLRRKTIAACQDPSHWGMAKSIAMQMIADGVDPADPVAGEAWIAAYDMRQLAAGDDPRGHTPPAIRRAASATRVKRTAAKQARRRNRSIRRK
jgi:hypothetical protein